MKNARKLVAAAMALAMTAALAPVNAFADTVIYQNTESKTGALVAKLTVQPSYTVTIPGDITLSTTTEKTADFKAENVMLENGQKIQVKLAEASNTPEGSTFHAKTSGSNPSTATYTISKDNAPVAVGGVVAEFTNTSAENPTQTQPITFSKASGNFYAGEHTETLTFSISMAEVETIDFTQQPTGSNFEYYLRNGTSLVAGTKVVPSEGAELKFDNDAPCLINVQKYPASVKNISKIEVVMGSEDDAEKVVAYKGDFQESNQAKFSRKGNTVTIDAEMAEVQIQEMPEFRIYYIYTTSTTPIYVKQMNIYYE